MWFKRERDVYMHASVIRNGLWWVWTASPWLNLELDFPELYFGHGSRLSLAKKGTCMKFRRQWSLVSNGHCVVQYGDRWMHRCPTLTLFYCMSSSSSELLALLTNSSH